MPQRWLPVNICLMNERTATSNIFKALHCKTKSNFKDPLKIIFKLQTYSVILTECSLFTSLTVSYNFFFFCSYYRKQLHKRLQKRMLMISFLYLMLKISFALKVFTWKIWHFATEFTSMIRYRNWPFYHQTKCYKMKVVKSHHLGITVNLY